MRLFFVYKYSIFFFNSCQSLAAFPNILVFPLNISHYHIKFKLKLIQILYEVSLMILRRELTLMECNMIGLLC